MHFALSGGRLDYARGWPELRDLAADITLDGARLDISGTGKFVTDYLEK